MKCSKKYCPATGVHQVVIAGETTEFMFCCKHMDGFMKHIAHSELIPADEGAEGYELFRATHERSCGYYGGEGWLCPNCPLCDKPPGIIIGPTQRVCANEDCVALIWNPQVDGEQQRAEMLAEMDRQK